MTEVMAEIQCRRAFRSITSAPVPRDHIELMVQAAHLAPSCFNYQPWRFIAIDDPAVLARVCPLLGSSNAWMRQSPALIAVCSHRDLDCKSSDSRDYFMFDSGIAVGFLMLQATRMGYIAHPVAGYKPVPIREILGIPAEWTLITLINIGRHGEDLSLLNDEQKEQELGSRVRKPLTEVFAWNRFAESMK
jgi:glutaredoxin-dependent peroxiredoxin